MRRGSASSTARAAGSSQSAEGNRASSVSSTTTDHEQIRRWAEERGAQPACVRRTGGKGDIGMIRLEFPGAPGARDENLEQISWTEWFKKFDESGLALLYEDITARGARSNFNKLVKRETAKARAARA